MPEDVTSGRPSGRSPAVVLGLSPTGLSIVRRLGRRGVAVVGVDPDPRAIGRHSRYCRYSEDLSRAASDGDAARLVKGLRALSANAPRAPVVFPTTDRFIELLAPVAAELESSCRLCTDLAAFGLTFLSKHRFYDLCRHHGVELPGTFMPGSLDELAALEGRLRYPVIIKPVFVHRFREVLGSRKVVRASDAGELRSRFAKLATVDSRLIVQEVIPGGDDQLWCALCYLDRKTELRCVFVARKLRQFPPGFGSASLAESRWNARVAELSERFLVDVGFRGLCATEFKYDARDGRFKMIEVNARLPLWGDLAPAAGVDVVYSCYADLTGESFECAHQVEGVRWVFASKDLLSALRYWWEGALGWPIWWRSLRGTRVEAVWAPDDPGPALRLPVYFAARAVSRLRTERTR